MAVNLWRDINAKTSKWLFYGRNIEIWFNPLTFRNSLEIRDDIEVSLVKTKIVRSPLWFDHDYKI